MSVDVVKKTNSDDNEVWRPVLEYEYAVGGKTYRGRRVRFGIPGSLVWLDPADPLFRGLHRGTHLDIRYSPLQPSLSVVQTKLSPFVYITLAAACASGWLGYSLLNIAP